MTAITAATARYAEAGPAPRRSLLAACLFSFFLWATLVAPATPINKVPFALMFIWMMWDQTWRRQPNTFTAMAPAAIVGIFVYGFAIALLNRVDMDLAKQLLLAPAVLLLVNFVVARRLDFDRIAVAGSYVVLLCTALFWASIGTGMPGAAQIYGFFMDYNFSGASNRDFFEGGATFTLQLGTAPWLFVGFCVVGMRLGTPASNRWDILTLVLICVGILISGLRGLVGITFLYGIYLVLRAMTPRMRALAVLGIVVVVWTVWLAVFSESQVFSAEEHSNSVKLGHWESYLHQLTWWNGIFGEGLGVYYYTTGTNSLRSFTELQPIDMCRYLGIPLTLVLYALLFFPLRGVWRYTRNRGGYTLAMLLFTVLSMTNPVMFNSYGLMVVVWYWCSLQPLQRTRPAAPPALPPAQTA